MKLIKKIIIFISFISLTLSCSMVSSTPAQEDAFLHISIDKLMNKDKEEIHKFECMKTSSSLNKNYSFHPKVSKKLHYYFSCRPTIAGSESLDLRVYYKGGLVQKIDSVASRVKNETEDYHVEAWLVDTNQDSLLDLIKKTQDLKADVKEEGVVKLSTWQKNKKSFVDQDLSGEELANLKSKYELNKK